MADKNLIEMNLLETVCEYTVPTPAMCVVMDCAKDDTIGNFRTLDATVVDFINHPVENKDWAGIHYDWGRYGWGAAYIPNDARLHKTLTLKAGDKIRLFLDGRSKQSNLVAVATCNPGIRGQQLYIKTIPYGDADIDIFTHRYFPCMSDKIKFNWAMIKTILSRGQCPHIKPADNLRHVLKIQGVREKYLAQYVADGHKR